MTASVDVKPSLITPGNVASNVAVRAQTWGDAAQILNMARGYGSVLVAPHFIGESVPTQTSYTYRYRATPTLSDSILVWVISCYSASPAVQFSPTYSAPVQIGVPGTFGQPPVYVYDNVTSQPTIETEYTLTVTTGSGSACFIQSISLIEMPRTALAASELGIDTATLKIGDPIYDIAGGSYSAIGASVGSVMAASRRVAQAHWSRVNPRTFTSTGFLNLFSGNPPTLTRRTLGTLGTRTVSVRVYARALVQPGEVQVYGVKALSFVTFAVPVSGSPAWTTVGQILVDAESAGTASGLVTGVFDTLQITARTTVTGGTCEVYAVSIWESENDVP